MRIFVTGAGGFIGKIVTNELLKQGHYVTAMVRKSRHISFEHPNIHFCLGDITDKTKLVNNIKGSDIIVHLAAAKSDEKNSYETNVIGSKNLLEACEINNVKGIINISTISTKLPDKGVYAKTKNQADEIFASGSIPVITLRLSIVYGDLTNGIFGTLIKSTKLPLVPVIGSGIFTSRPIHVRDVAQAIQKVISRPFSGHTTYDLGGPDTIPFNELVKRIAREINNRNVLLFHIPIFFGYVTVRILKLIFKKPPLTTSNVMAMHQEVQVLFEVFCKDYNFHPRSLLQGLADLRQQRDEVVSESRILMNYILSATDVSIGDYQVALYEKVIKERGYEKHKINPWILNNNLYIYRL